MLFQDVVDIIGKFGCENLSVAIIQSFKQNLLGVLARSCVAKAQNDRERIDPEHSCGAKSEETCLNIKPPDHCKKIKGRHSDLGETGHRLIPMEVISPKAE